MENGDKDEKNVAVTEGSTNSEEKDQDEDLLRRTEMLNAKEAINSSNENSGNDSEAQIHVRDDSQKEFNEKMNKEESSDPMEPTDSSQTEEDILAEDKSEEPVFDGTEVAEMEDLRRSSNQSAELDSDAHGSVLNERATAIKNFVKEKGAIAVSTFIRRLSGKKDENEFSVEDEKNEGSESISSGNIGSDAEPKSKEVQPKSEERTTWNPLNLIKIGRDFDTFMTGEAGHENVPDLIEQPTGKGRIIVYTKLGCEDCKLVRSFMRQKMLKYVEINIDIFPSRKMELENNTGSSTVPKVYFNDLLIGGLTELKKMEESGILDDRTDALFKDEPSSVAPLPPLPGEDDESGSGKIDELATIVRKMRESIILKDRFYKMRRFSSCFLGSEAVDFLSEDQYLERDEAVEFGRKLASKYFYRHVLDEDVFEDGNHLYRFLDNDPIIMSQCYNIPKGIMDVEPKPIVEVASRLRKLSQAMFEAYVSEDGKHVDYRSIQGCEEFKRYVRTTEELQRVETHELSREEKLAFFINLYNMMAIHALVTCGHPAGPLDRRKFFGDFKYVIGGCAYSLSAIQNGILRGNQRPPYNLAKPFGQKDQRSKVALPYAEPLVHFALVCGTKSGPALRCYSPGNIDKELVEAARDFLRNRGIVVDPEAKVASVSKILRWYSTDFGKNETEVLKHAANYLEPAESEQFLELLANTQLKVLYQPYDWSLNI
uniref:DEP domain-containing protein n=1 Tax=Oryza meridionalis TaxID=40149 RepID=A0A0E0DZA6_9ORYZ